MVAGDATEVNPIASVTVSALSSECIIAMISNNSIVVGSISLKQSNASFTASANCKNLKYEFCDFIAHHYEDEAQIILFICHFL